MILAADKLEKYLVITDDKMTTRGLYWRAVMEVPICHLFNSLSHVATATRKVTSTATLFTLFT